MAQRPDRARAGPADHPGAGAGGTYGESLGIPFQRLVEIEPAAYASFRWQGDTVRLHRGERATLTDDQVAYIEALGVAIERVG